MRLDIGLILINAAVVSLCVNGYMHNLSVNDVTMCVPLDSFWTFSGIHTDKKLHQHFVHNP